MVFYLQYFLGKQKFLLHYVTSFQRPKYMLPSVPKSIISIIQEELLYKYTVVKKSDTCSTMFLKKCDENGSMEKI